MWSDWFDWSECSVTCGFESFEIRERACDNPTPQHDGIYCQEDSEETRSPCVPNPPLCIGKNLFIAFIANVSLSNSFREFEIVKACNSYFDIFSLSNFIREA